MDSCYSDDNIAEDHLHPDTTKRNTEEPQQGIALERSVIDYWGSLNMFYWVHTSPTASATYLPD